MQPRCDEHCFANLSSHNLIEQTGMGHAETHDWEKEDMLMAGPTTMQTMSALPRASALWWFSSGFADVDAAP